MQNADIHMQDVWVPESARLIGVSSFQVRPPLCAFSLFACKIRDCACCAITPEKDAFDTVQMPVYRV